MSVMASPVPDIGAAISDIDRAVMEEVGAAT